MGQFGITPQCNAWLGECAIHSGCFDFTAYQLAYQPDAPFMKAQKKHREAWAKEDKQGL